jgi:hypothetical protein
MAYKAVAGTRMTQQAGVVSQQPAKRRPGSTPVTSQPTSPYTACLWHHCLCAGIKDVAGAAALRLVDQLGPGAREGGPQPGLELVQVGGPVRVNVRPLHPAAAAVAAAAGRQAVAGNAPAADACREVAAKRSRQLSTACGGNGCGVHGPGRTGHCCDCMHPPIRKVVGMAAAFRAVLHRGQCCPGCLTDARTWVAEPRPTLMLPPTAATTTRCPLISLATALRMRAGSPCCSRPRWRPRGSSAGT